MSHAPQPAASGRPGAVLDIVNVVAPLFSLIGNGNPMISFWPVLLETLRPG